MFNWFKILLASAGVCASCGTGGITDLSPSEFDKAVQSDSLAIVIDSRTPEEYSDGHLSGAILMDIKDPDLFDKKASSLDKSKHYYIYCRSGKRSLVAAERLHKEGFEVFNMNGGILAWKAEGLPVTNE